MLVQMLLSLIVIKTDVQVHTFKRAANFNSKPFSDQQAGLTYFRIMRNSSLGLLGENTPIQCMDVCMNFDTCLSFNVKGGGCVFAMTDMNSFDEDFIVSDVQNETFLTKGMA